MIQKLSSLIYKQLMEEDQGQLPPGLKGGQTGWMLFMALYSEANNHAKARQVSAHALMELRKGLGRRPSSLLYGDLGIGWALQLLCRRGILEKGNAVVAVLEEIHKAFMLIHYAAPMSIFADDNLFSGGLYTLGQRPDKECFEQYAVDERLISLTEECEQLLMQPLPTLHHSPENITLSLLHSYIYFLLEVHDKGVFPYKTSLLLSLAIERYKQIEDKPACDEYIYHSLLQDGETTLPDGMKPGDLLRLLGETGFYSLLYEGRIDFKAALNEAEQKYPGFLKRACTIIKGENLSVGTLCGWGYGLLQLLQK